MRNRQPSSTSSLLLLTVLPLTLVLQVTLSFAPPLTTTTTTTTTRSTQTPVPLFSSTPNGRADVEVVLGSESSSGRTEQGLYEDDVDEDQLERWKRQERVQALLQEGEEEYRQERKRKKWGKFANVTNKEDLVPLLQQEALKVEQGE